MGLNAECEHCRHNCQCGNHGCAGIEKCGGNGCLGNVLVLLQVRTVYDHTAACDGQGEECLTHGHDPGVGVCQLFPLGHEQEFVACGCPGQECHTDSYQNEQHEKCGHQNLIQLFNALGGAQQQAAAAQYNNQCVAGYVAQCAAHFSEECTCVHCQQLTCEAAQQALENPAENDGVANGNAQRAEQGNPAQCVAQLALAASSKAVFIGTQCAGLCAAADCKFRTQTYQTKQNDENNIRNQKCSAAVLTQTVGEQPDVAHANRRANACQNEAKAGAEAAVHVHSICLLVIHVFSFKWLNY